MDRYRTGRWSRREFLGGVALTGTAGLVGLNVGPASADPPPETTTIRLINDPAFGVICYAPQFVAAQLLRGEGFTDVRYSKLLQGSEPKTLAAGWADLSAAFVGDLITALDAEAPIVVLTGLHGGCYELVGSERVRTIHDLKGKKVALSGVLGTGPHTFLSTMLAYVGLDPRKDVIWVPLLPPAAIRAFAEGKVDAIFAFPPAPQELRTKKIGHVLLSTAKDPPWSQYFCCMVGARREFVQKYPAATKRALRAILKANQLCTLEPERSARMLVDQKFTSNYDYTLQVLKDVRYDTWRDYDPEETLRFHALRMREIGAIKSTPQKIIARGTDWRYVNELKKELKG